MKAKEGRWGAEDLFTLVRDQPDGVLWVLDAEDYVLPAGELPSVRHSMIPSMAPSAAGLNLRQHLADLHETLPIVNIQVV